MQGMRLEKLLALSLWAGSSLVVGSMSSMGCDRGGGGQDSAGKGIGGGGGSNQSTAEEGDESGEDSDNTSKSADKKDQPKVDLDPGEDKKKKDPDNAKPENDCDEVAHKPCDEDSDDPLHAFGINCPGAVPKIEASFKGAPESRGVRKSLGNTSAFDPREGKRFLVIGSGRVDEISNETPAGDHDGEPRMCNDNLGKKWNPGAILPAPIKTNRVGAKDCSEDPSLVGKGDCSNTIEAQWNAAILSPSRANDYSELRLKIKVPKWAKSFSYDFAFLTTEYPHYYKNMYNDFFIAWLESKKWTGNVSFDEKGKPISLNAGFLDYKDANRGLLNDPDCTTGCTAKELHGSCFKQHAGTKWLTTTVGVTPGEDIELVLAIMDLGDSVLDSYVLLDNFRWSCDEQKKPKTDWPK